MLDPDLSYRITSRQLTALICQPEYYYSSVLKASRARCVGPAAIENSNLPLHSVFKDVNALEYPISAEQGLIETSCRTGLGSRQAQVVATSYMVVKRWRAGDRTKCVID
jgi:hypothetical protein